MKSKCTLMFLFFYVSFYAQEFQGKAIYKTHRKIEMKIDVGKKGASNSKLQKQLQEQIKKMFQKTYTLSFNKTESVFTQNSKLAAPNPKGNGMFIMGGNSNSDILYKNIPKKRFAKQTEIMSKRFLIKDSLEDYQWQLTDETKNIGNYTCYKATREKVEPYIKYSFKNGKMTEEKATRTIKTEAWYTPQIPVSHGPKKYWGLPGLILEIKEGKLTIVCTEIEMNPKEKVRIKEPTKGKKVTLKEFEKIQRKKSKEMMERFQNNRKGKKNGNTISIQFNG